MAQHPGDHLRVQYLEPLGLSLRTLAQHLGVSPASVSRLVTGKADLSASMAVRLGLAFGQSADSWMALQTTFAMERAKAEVTPDRVIPVPMTGKMGWTKHVPTLPGHYEWRNDKDGEVHAFEVVHQPVSDGCIDTVYRCWTITDFSFIKRHEGEWRRVDG